jgi:Flp pilus assembly protein TadD
MKLLRAILLVIPMCLVLGAQTSTQQQPATQPNAGSNASTSTDDHGEGNQNGHWRKIKVKYVTNPADATARCRDQTYSKSDHVSGTCAHHGGVEKWLKPVRLE